MMSFSGLGGLRASSPEAPGLQYDTNLNTLSTQTPRGQKLHEYIKEKWQIKIMAVFFSSLMKRVFNFMRNPKLAHILVHLYAHLLPPFPAFRCEFVYWQTLTIA